jgi:hypothetical protein
MATKKKIKAERSILGDKMRLTKSSDLVEYYVSDVGNVLLDRSRIAKFWKNKKFNSNKFAKINENDLNKLINSQQTVFIFGLSSLTFGNWLTYEERVEFLIGLTDALYLIYETVYSSYSKKAIGQNILGISLGGRGKGGRALAHYEPFGDFINLTKPHISSGSLFHEYAHFVDYNLARRLKLKDEHFISGGDSTRKKVDEDKLKSNIKLVRLFEELFQKLYWDDRYNKATTFQVNLRRASAYYNYRSEVFARTCEVYIALKTKKPNSILTGKKHDSNVYPSNESVKECTPILDQIFQTFAAGR